MQTISTTAKAVMAANLETLAAPINATLSQLAATVFQNVASFVEERAYDFKIEVTPSHSAGSFGVTLNIPTNEPGMLAHSSFGVYFYAGEPRVIECPNSAIAATVLSEMKADAELWGGIMQAATLAAPDYTAAAAYLWAAGQLKASIAAEA